jgi:hypothetical protein
MVMVSTSSFSEGDAVEGFGEFAREETVWLSRASLRDVMITWGTW